MKRRAMLVSLLGAGATGAVVAQGLGTPGQSNEPRVLSGPDIGFRVERVARDGTPVGSLVVRVDGNWVEAQFQPVVRRAT